MMALSGCNPTVSLGAYLYMYKAAHRGTDSEGDGLETTQKFTRDRLNKSWPRYTVEYYAVVTVTEVCLVLISIQDLVDEIN